MLLELNSIPDFSLITSFASKNLLYSNTVYLTLFEKFHLTIF
jgi:hypothetical protein